MKNAREQQLMLAARTVRKTTPRKRADFIRRKLGEVRQSIWVAATAYHLATGTVPRSLWNND